MNYRNKTIFDWNNFQTNEISSIISLKIMEIFKLTFNNLNIHNVIIRDVNNQIAIIFQIDKHEFTYELGNPIFNMVNYIVNNLNYELKLFAIQYLHNKKFDKAKNIIYFKKQFINFEVNYIDYKKICLLPDSFYQANISVLNQFYSNFYKWIKLSKCNNMINLGDDGGNVCTILSSLFTNMISYFHCPSSYECAEEMIKINKISNLSLTYNLNDISNFIEAHNNIVLFINPGRKGLQKKEMNFIKSNNIKYIIYMACNQKAFIKDLNQINYKINEFVSILNMPIINKYQNLYFLYSEI